MFCAYSDKIYTCLLTSHYITNLIRLSIGGCVLLLDQVESLCRKRESSSEGHLIRIANQLFMLLETVNDTAGLVVVGTSSRPQALDPALRRPGHFDHEVF